VADPGHYMKARIPAAVLRHPAHLACLIAVLIALTPLAVAAQSLPAGWSSQDIGAVGLSTVCP